MLMFHYRFANATQVFLCNPYWWKLENMKNEPNSKPNTLGRVYTTR